MAPTKNEIDSASGKPEAGLFATTHWSVVLRAGQDHSAEAGSALENLCAAYWYPLYSYIRRQGHSAHDAEDLAQAFFAHLLALNYVRLADRNRGRFRTFLLTSLKNFLINEWKQANRHKRSAGQRLVSLDEVLAESRFAAEPAIAQPPEAHYDRVWATTLMERALTALRAEFDQSGKRDLFERLKEFVWGGKNALPYAAMAEQLGMTGRSILQHQSNF